MALSPSAIRGIARAVLEATPFQAPAFDDLSAGQQGPFLAEALRREIPAEIVYAEHVAHSKVIQAEDAALDRQSREIRDAIRGTAQQ